MAPSATEIAAVVAGRGGSQPSLSLDENTPAATSIYENAIGGWGVYDRVLRARLLGRMEAC